jgi:hypothetical protein
MALPNSEKITSQIAMLPDAALKQMAMMHKSDPYVLPLIISEDGRRKQMRQAAQAQMAGMPQPKVADAALAQMGQLPEEQGIGALPAPNMQHMADGGIAGFDESTNAPITTKRLDGMGKTDGMFNYAQDGGGVMRMAGGGMPGYAKGDAIKVYEDRIRAEAVRQGVDPDLAVRMFTQESRGDKNAVSPKGAAGLGQLMIPAAKEMGLTPAERFDPEKNIPASVGYLKKQLVKYDGDPEKALAAYNWGGGNVDKHLAKNEGRLNKIGLPKETADYLTKILPMGSARAEDVPQASKPAPAQPEALTEKERAALEQPAFMTPSSGKGRQEGRLSETIKSGEAPRQMALGVSDLPYNILGAPMDIGYAVSKAFGNKGSAPALGSEHLKQLGTKYLGREAESTDPTLRGFRTAGEFAGMAIDPFATTRKVAQTAEGLESLALAQRAKTAEAEAKVATPVGMRLEPPRTEPPVMVADAQGRVMPADTRARVQQALADEAAVGTEAAKAAQLEKQAAAYPGSMQRAEMERLAGVSDKTRGTALAAETGNLAESGIKTLTKTEVPQLGMEPVRADEFGTAEADMPKPSDLIAATKETVPTKDRKGFDNEDLLTLGLSLMANKSPNFMTALGESGIQTLSAKKEREKRETDLEYKDIMKKYYGALGTKAEAESKNLEAGTKYNAAARQHAMDNISREMQKWEQSLGGVAATPQQAEAKRLALTKFYFPLAGLEVPSTIGSPAPSAGFKVLGSRPQ